MRASFATNLQLINPPPPHTHTHTHTQARLEGVLAYRMGQVGGWPGRGTYYLQPDSHAWPPCLGPHAGQPNMHTPSAPLYTPSQLNVHDPL